MGDEADADWQAGLTEWGREDAKFCQGIYAGCCIVPSAPCRPCQRIAQGKSTVEKEMALKERRERR